jgi:excisionase family DNA binding protein
MTNNEWKTPAQAAEHFGVSTKTVRRWIDDGIVYAERIGPRLIRVDIASMLLTKIGPEL